MRKLVETIKKRPRARIRCGRSQAGQWMSVVVEGTGPSLMVGRRPWAAYVSNPPPLSHPSISWHGLCHCYNRSQFLLHLQHLPSHFSQHNPFTLFPFCKFITNGWTKRLSDNTLFTFVYCTAFSVSYSNGIEIGSIGILNHLPVTVTSHIRGFQGHRKISEAAFYLRAKSFLLQWVQWLMKSKIIWILQRLHAFNLEPAQI